MIPIVDPEIYLRRRNRVALPEPDGGAPVSDTVLATCLRNLAGLGAAFAPALVDACRALSDAQVVALHDTLVPLLRRRRGAHRAHRPFYAGFPTQVMEMAAARRYLNALVHYLSDGRLRPRDGGAPRPPLAGRTPLERIEPGDPDDFEGLFTQIAAANASLSEEDRADLEFFVRTRGDAIVARMPERVPQKETAAFLAGLLLEHASRDAALDALSGLCRTATDVLRLAVALSGGDLSLAAPTRFRVFSRPERALLLGLLERVAHPLEDMARHRGAWVRLGERLHPGEKAARYPTAAAAFAALRGDAPLRTFRGGVETALARRDTARALARLSTRPGELARRLDHLLRLDPASAETVLATFADVAADVATPVLLQARHHFLQRGAIGEQRVFFPKGDLAKCVSVPNALPEMAPELCAGAARVCEEALRARFARREPLGAVYVDPALAEIAVPFGRRSASRALRPLARGTRLPLPDADTLRFFLWWTNGADRTDIDLSVTALDDAFAPVGLVSYTNLVAPWGVHSGDIVDAPHGASEFVDLNVPQALGMGIRYAVLTLHSFTQQPYGQLPECFAGWMARHHPKSGEVFEPRTVVDRIDLTADTRVALPLVADLQRRRVVWCDLSVRRNPHWANNVQGNVVGIARAVRALVERRPPDLYDLFALHAAARGTLVDDPEVAQTVFSVASGTPYRLEEIASEYLA